MHRSTWITVLLSILGFVAVVAVLGLIYIYSGAYNVAATDDLAGPTRWLFSAVTENSIEARAQPLQPPLKATPAMLREGAEHYREMCVTCHGAPGVEPGEFSEGLVPAPPALDKGAPEAGAVYWVLQHGIKHTGMGAIGPTHNDEQIRALTAFVLQLPKLSPQRYQALTASAADEPAAHDTTASHHH